MSLHVEGELLLYFFSAVLLKIKFLSKMSFLFLKDDHPISQCLIRETEPVLPEASFATGPHQQESERERDMRRVRIKGPT